MPCDYRKYPSNWLTEIRPRIMKRANNQCEVERCNFYHGQVVYAVKYRGKSNWYETFDEANKQPKTIESKRSKATGIVNVLPNPKPVKVILTIAHLDHDETNKNVKDERLMAMCQLCHLRYDAKEKYKRTRTK